MTIISSNTTTTILAPIGPRGPAGIVTPELQALVARAETAAEAAEAALAVILAGGGNAGGGTPGGGTTPAPAFPSQPTISPASGQVGTTFTATPGVATNGVITRRWMLAGLQAGTGLTCTPDVAGTLTYQETATGAGGTTTSTLLTRTVAANTSVPAPVYTSQPTITPDIAPLGTTYTATPGVASNATSYTRAWLLNGTSIGSGLTVTPVTPGTLTYQETANGAGGSVQSVVRSATVSNATPTPTPEVPIDLGSAGPFYAQPNAYTNLNLGIPADTTNITLTRSFTDAQLKVRRREDTVSFIPAEGSWRTIAVAGPYAVQGTGFVTSPTMIVEGTGTPTLRNGNILLPMGKFLTSAALGMEFVGTGKLDTALTPPSLTVAFKGVLPSARDRAVLIGDIAGPDGVVFQFVAHDWGRSLGVAIGGRGEWNVFNSQAFETSINDANHTLAVTYTDNLSGPGGSFTFFVDGVQIGAPIDSPAKPKVASGCFIQVNASQDNTTNSVAGVEVESIKVSYGKPKIDTNYLTVSDGAITAANLNALAIDATGVTTTQPARQLTYKIGAAPAVNIDIVVGEYQVDSTGAYKAVLEDWSTGVAVPHPNELVMTLPAAQRVSFEDATLGGNQGYWTEVLPQGAPPILDGIRYTCEGIRQGNYSMFQFMYAIERLGEPFGDVEGLNTYMRPHKWAIYDKAGTLIERIQQPDGKPLNPSDTSPVWQGQYDGRSVAMTTPTNKWYPHGTARASIVWRDGTPPAYTEAFIQANLPRYDLRVPFGSHANDSVNGYDGRIYIGGNAGEGQSNGFGNWKATPWEWGQYDYQSIKAVANTTLDPWKNLFNDFGLTTNAANWSKYTPWNSVGRSPVVGPGGTRDDRQIIPEPVAQYMRFPTGNRRTDDKPLKDIALSYMTAYASDPFHTLTNGKSTPLYRGAARKAIRSRNHYYGYGEHNIPESSALYFNSGHLYNTTSSQNPTITVVPYAGMATNKPYFGTFEIDQMHAHQFPHWASMLWKSPEFAMLGVSFSDMARLYENDIISSIYAPSQISNREKAWLFMHATLCWKTASKTSTRLYSRAEILDWVITDFELFSDQWLNSTPGYKNPPTNVMVGGEIKENLVVLAGAPKFGPMECPTGTGLECSEFQIGYWRSALYAAHKLGFLDAIRTASAKAGEVVDFMINLHRKQVTGRLNGGMLLSTVESDYRCQPWSWAAITAANGVVANLPQTYAAAATARGPAPAWDKWLDGAAVKARDGQAMDALLAGPAILKDMGLTGSDLDQAETQGEAYFQEKLASETARGYDLAGSQWFKYHQTTNNRPYKPAA
jgi:hypothetical protein